VSFLSRILRALERRDAAGFGTTASYAHAFGLAPDAAPRMVAPHLAENLAAVTACVNAITGPLSTFPVIPYRRAGEGRREVEGGHWLALLLRRPNRLQSLPELWEMMLADALLTGQGYAEIIFDAGGRVTELRPIPARLVRVEMLANGRLVYEVAPGDGRWNGGPARRLLDDRIWTVRDRSDNGITGRSRLSRAAAAIGDAMALQDASSALWNNRLMVSGLITAPQVLTDKQRGMASAMLEAFRGAQRAGKVPILEGGWTWQSVAVDPETAEMLGSRRLSTETVASIFGVPPPIIGDLSHGTMHNVGEMVRHFAQTTLAGWARRMEASFARDVLGSSADLSIECDMSAVLRGDPETRFKTYEIAIRNGILSAEECRAVEGWNKRATGEQPAPQQQEAPG
jgi:HK97 family phage portal protein